MQSHTEPRGGVLEDLTAAVHSTTPREPGASEGAWSVEGDVLRDLLGGY